MFTFIMVKSPFGLIGCIMFMYNDTRKLWSKFEEFGMKVIYV